MYPSCADEPGCWSRAYSRTWLLVPGSVVIRAQTSVSAPYWLLLRHAVQVVVFVQASRLDATRRPVSTEPMIPFDQRPESDSGFSLRRLKLSSVGSGSSGASTEVVALAPFE